MTSDPADESEPDISADGEWIAFRSEREGGGIYIIRSRGGSAGLIAPQGRGPRFSPDGKFIAYWIGESYFAEGHLFLVSVPWRSNRALVPGFSEARNPVWSEDGRYLLFEGSEKPTDNDDWWIVPIDGSSPVPTGFAGMFAQQRIRSESAPCWFGSSLLFAARGTSTNLWSARFSPGSPPAAGIPTRITFGSGHESHPAIAKDGRLIFASLVESTKVCELRLNRAGIGAIGAYQQLTNAKEIQFSPLLLYRKMAGLPHSALSGPDEEVSRCSISEAGIVKF